MSLKPRKGLTLVTLLVSIPLTACAAPFLDFYGYSFCDRDFLGVGSTTTIPVCFNSIQPEPALTFDFGQYEVTGVIDGLEVVSAETHGPVRVLHYEGGELHAYQDPGRNAEWAVDPPNDAVPAFFEEGELILLGFFTDCRLVYDTVRRVGTVQGHLDFTAGSRLAELPQQTGWLFFGGVTADPQGGLPAGYALAWDPQLLAQAPVATQRATWGGIKAIYR
jgi:hypothetical protein